MADPQKDLDAFLTSVESKLRGPFSSLDLSKAVSTRALRGSLSADEYLDRISQVLSRSDKIIQMRVMVGLLGLDPEQDTDREIDKILTQAQEGPLHEEWVRIISGLVQGIMFQNEDDTRSRGQEANERLEKTCTEIIRRVQELEQDTEEMQDDPSRLTTADVDPTFAPYRYALLNPTLLKATLPETQSHEHFQVQEEADILLMDQNEDQARVQEEQEHATSGRQVKRPLTAGGTAATTGTGQAAKNASSSATATRADIPGFGRPKPKAAVSNRPKTSMFMPRKLGAATPAARAAGTVKPVVKTTLHTRKAGAAQMLLNKGKRNRLNAMAGSSAAASAAVPGVRGRANKLGNNRSRMQMIDVAEVQDLAKEQIGRVDQKDTGKKVAGQKRKSEATTEKSARSKKEETNGTAVAATATAKAPEAPPKANAKPKAATVAAASTTEDSAGALASAALSKYQAQLAGAQQATTNNNSNNNNAGSNSNSNTAGAPAPGTSAPQASSTPKQQDWRHLLKEKSNKLSADDRFRVSESELILSRGNNFCLGRKQRRECMLLWNFAHLTIILLFFICACLVTGPAILCRSLQPDTSSTDL
jgi:hypothetical protein